MVVAVGWVSGIEAGSIPGNSQGVAMAGTRAALLMGSCTSHVPASQDGGTLLVGKRRSFRSPASPLPASPGLQQQHRQGVLKSSLTRGGRDLSCCTSLQCCPAAQVGSRPHTQVKDLLLQHSALITFQQRSSRLSA